MAADSSTHAPGIECDTWSVRFFNTTGPIVPARHYHVPPLERLRLGHVLMLIRDERYFVLHAPRQTGKTTALLALRDLLNGGESGHYRCVYVNVEAGQAAREDTGEAMRAILHELADAARITLGDESLAALWPEALATAGAHGALGAVLTRWSEADPKPLVLLLDEVDSLVGDTLISLLRQLRSGYTDRPGHFPQSVILCGVRDVRDYRIRSSAGKDIVTGGSAFNIKAESLVLGDFTEQEVNTLLDQHTTETGQEFTGGAKAAIFRQTRGQPWLVNALAARTCPRDESGKYGTGTVAAEDVLAAQEDVILSRETHLDQLADKLQEERVRRVVGPLLSGGDEREFSARDTEYVRDLGLIARSGPLRIANPIYAEVVPRELTLAAQEGLVQDAAWYVEDDGSLDLPRLLAAFQEFFREHSEHWIPRFDYWESGPQLLLQAFLQRIVNGGGRIEREYGLGRGRTDLLVVWPRTGGTDRFVIECEILRGSLERTVSDGLEQTAAYMDRCAADAGHLVIFDRAEGTPWQEKIFRRKERAGDATVTVWGM